MKSLGFKRSIITAVVMLVTVCLLTANWLSYSNLKATTITSIDAQSKAIVRYEADKIQAWFKGKSDAIDTLAQHYVVNESSDYYVETAAMARQLSGISQVLYGLDTGRAYSTIEGGYWSNGVADPRQYDPRQRPWYQQGKASAGLGVTDIYEDASNGKHIVSVMKRVSDGVILGDIELDILEETVKAVDFPGAVTAIMDASGKAIASNSNRLTEGVHFADIGMDNVRISMLAQPENRTTYTLDGVDKLAFTRVIELVNGKRWYLFIGVNKSVAYAVVEQALQTAIWSSLIMLLAAVGLTVVTLNGLYRPILALKEVVMDLSQGNGDLTRRLPVTSDDDLGQISKGINQFIINLQSLMLEVSQSSAHISHSVEQVKNQTDSNNAVLEAHTTETEQVVAAIEEMSATANDVASNAANASQFTQSTNVQVSESKRVVLDATSTVSQLVGDVDTTANNITEISKDTSDITNVLKVIGEIADQTNLLALNAAIEAARAGEQGRGFAVVADEVRALAARTQSSTAEIEATLSKLHSGSESAMTAMNHTKTSCQRTAQSTTQVADDLDTIVQSVAKINDLNTHIATAAEEQSSVTGEISRNISAIRDIVVQLATNGEATAQESMNLAAANSQLKSVVGKFKLQ